MKLSFKIEQLAFSPKDPVAAQKLLADMGAAEWIDDHVCANGKVFGDAGANEADLRFNYTAFAGKELELLHYTSGPNWLDSRERGTVSHIGMHCSAEELVQWRAFFKERGIRVAQEVLTASHTNPAISGKRTYNYVIFDTKEILGVDTKFIVRKSFIVECLVCQARQERAAETGHEWCAVCNETTNHQTVRS